MSVSGAADAYYRAMEGAWRGRLTTTVDIAALEAAQLGALDRLAWKATAHAPAWMETRVQVLPDGVVLHETLLRSFGLPAAWGAERIVLGHDGRSFSMRGEHRLAWVPWQRQIVEGPGEVREDVAGASYAFDYLGARVTQITEREAEGVLRVTQTTAFSKSEVRLVRQPPKRLAPVLMATLLAATTFAWLWPHRTVVPIAFLLFASPIAGGVVLSRRPFLRDRWAVALLVALVATFTVTLIGNSLADAGLEAIRAELVRAHELTGRYPETLAGVPPAGLPGTLRTYRYQPDAREPLISYPQVGEGTGALGRQFLLVGSGERAAGY